MLKSRKDERTNIFSRARKKQVYKFQVVVVKGVVIETILNNLIEQCRCKSKLREEGVVHKIPKEITENLCNCDSEHTSLSAN